MNAIPTTPHRAEILRRMLFTLLLLLALLLIAACDERASTEQSSSSSSSSSADEDSSTLSDEDIAADACWSQLEIAEPVCTADADAEGDDVICMAVDDGSVTTVVEESADDDNGVFGFYSEPDSTDPRTEVGVAHNTDAEAGDPYHGRDALGFLFESQSTGTHGFARFSSWTAWDDESYRAVGSDEGCGLVVVEDYDAVGGRIRGWFDSLLCAYNGSIHVVQCDMEETRVQGAFDVTRSSDVSGGSGTPFLGGPKAFPGS